MRIDWAARLGLAETPMFERHEQAGDHRMLLDGVSGSFGLSSVDAFDAAGATRDWAWSCGVLHHVSETDDEVMVQRWDEVGPTTFTARSVRDNLDRFYESLTRDHAAASRGVAEHAVDAFRRLRSHFGAEEGETALSVYLLVLATMLEPEGRSPLDDPASVARRFALPDDAEAGVRTLGPEFVRHLVSAFRHPRLPRGPSLETLPGLLLRHAGATVFQEAHLEASGSGTYDIFGVPDAPRGRRPGAPGGVGVHYTPPGLARSLAERALSALDPLPDRMTILDPACGSGSMLHETLRMLRDRAYPGEVRVVGFDESEAAVRTSRFFMAATRRDWSDLRVADVAVERRDSLDEAPWPVADLVVMNPPFVSLRDLTKAQRSTLARALGDFDKGRPDLSMAFVERASSGVRQGGVVATLVPAGVLAMTQASDWRRHLYETCDVDLVASFGEVGLFKAATVEIGAMVLRRGASGRSPTFSSLWVGPKSGSSSEALRFLRRSRGGVGSEPGRWSLDEQPARALADGRRWRPRPAFLRREIEAFARSSPTTVENLFQVRQGAIPAPREAFMVDEAYVASLPPGERRWFRRVAEHANISLGRIEAGPRVFFARSEGLPAVEDEAALAAHVPTFYPRLLAHKAALSRRRGRAERWWELGEDRGWLRSPSLKIVTAYFGQAGAFAVDADRDHVVVHGYGWLPTTRGDPVGASAEDVLHAYAALLNTDLFQRILSEFCQVIGGGQLNLSKRYVSSVPLPDFRGRLASSDGEDRVVSELVAIGRSMARVGLPRSPRRRAEDLAHELYGMR